MNKQEKPANLRAFLVRWHDPRRVEVEHGGMKMWFVNNFFLKSVVYAQHFYYLCTQKRAKLGCASDY